MDFIHNFFHSNQEIIYFGYGLVFFVMGLAIALQSRTSSRLDLARSLSWLSLFGFSHGFHEWGTLFIPLQSQYLPTATIRFMYQLHLLLLAVSFTFLFQFGVALLRPLGRARWLHTVAAGLLAIWVFTVYFPLNALIPDFDTWHNTANVLARYLIGFPGALLAAYALRQHTINRIAPLQVPHIVRFLRFGGYMLALYGVFAGLIGPPIPFFPGNLLNASVVEMYLLAPVPVFRSLVGLGLAIAIIRGLEIFDVETIRIIEDMEQKQILASERERIGRELHDGAIQKVYTAGLLVESATKQVDSDQQVLLSRLERAQAVLNQAIQDLRRSLSELYTSPTSEPLAEALTRLADDPRFRSMVDVHLKVDLPAGESLTPTRTEDVLAVANEALSNVVRHAKARHVKVDARRTDERFILDIVDDGISIPEEPKLGYGLRNMRDRARLLGGEIEILPAGSRGTKVSLNIPWKDER